MHCPVSHLPASEDRAHHVAGRHEAGIGVARGRHEARGHHGPTEAAIRVTNRVRKVGAQQHNGDTALRAKDQWGEEHEQLRPCRKPLGQPALARRGAGRRLGLFVASPWVGWRGSGVGWRWKIRSRL